MSSEINKLQKLAIAQSFSRAAASYDQAALLQQIVEKRLFDQLALLKHSYHAVLDVGSGTGRLSGLVAQHYPDARVYGCDIAEGMVVYAKYAAAGNKAIKHPPVFVCADAENLPFADHSFDVIVSNLALQWCIDIDAVFKSFYRLLKPGGALFFSTLGLGTLHELHASWRAVYPDAQLHTFIDMHDIGDILHANKFLGAVMSQETITLKYKTVSGLLRDLNQVGANCLPVQETLQERRGMLGKQAFQAVSQAYEQQYSDGKGFLSASYEVVYGHAVR